MNTSASEIRNPTTYAAEVRTQNLSKAFQTDLYFELFFVAREQSLKKLPPWLPFPAKCRSRTELLFAREQLFQ